ncbi:MAG: DUF4123 domain-containing protein [Pseudomonadota bacterium]
MTIHYGLHGSRDDLLTEVTNMPREWYAVIDGAQVEDVDRKLASQRFVHTPLYFEGTDEVAIANGPFLVMVPDPSVAARLIALTADGPSPVFWSWAGGDKNFVQHLRRKAMMRIPPEDPAQRPAWDNVLFRHADANVLATTLEVLTPEQQASFIGRGKVISFYAPDALGLVVARRPIDLPKVERETISFTPQQYEQIEQNRVIRNRRRVMNYLRRTAEYLVSSWEDEKLYQEVCEAERLGLSYGLLSEHAHWLWAWLFVWTEREIAASSDIRSAITESGYDPDLMVDHLFDRTIEALRV